MDWRQIAADFAFDGSWRDIYVLSTTLSDWQVVLDMVRELEPAPIYQVDGVARALPDRTEDAFESRASAAVLLSFSIGKAVLNCHFFAVDEIEFDLDPREIGDSDQYERLVAFMRLLGELTGKVVLLTPENFKECPIPRYSPDTRQIAWVPREIGR
ncbi:MAG: hypothetical protein ACRC67_27580 [Inquilinus sp.]|uniref:hypothetical protein n=1 Tax=Inquilinus sp. TaxID=1932117 RepID=UPI003F39C307